MTEKAIPSVPDKRKSTDVSPASEITREEERFLTPPVDIYETRESLVVVADLPGVEKDTLDINIKDNILTIKAKGKAADIGTPIYKEYDLLNYFRQFEMTEEVDQDKITAEFKQGVLTINLQKVQKVQPKQIPVNVA